MNMYERFAKKYGSLPEEDDSFEQGFNTEILDPSDNSGRDPAITEVVPGPKGKFEDLNIPKHDKVPSFEDTEEEDNSFDLGMDSPMIDNLDPVKHNLTPVVPNRANKLSRNEIVKLCDLFFELATS